MISALRQYLPHILVAVALLTILGASYASVLAASNSSPKAIWSTNPITITGATGHATDSFKCAPAYNSPITLVVSNPSALTVSPSTFSSCGNNFMTITLTAHSATSTTVTVTIHKGSQYGSTIPPPLVVKIVVH
ncbi:MAG TPA: hypothetical protein VE955_09945 [Candidatus Dormibacteraeota bacterium]|nr:hypothetical protein [Candidatus Dormibacteraeota bacterium]